MSPISDPPVVRDSPDPAQLQPATSLADRETLQSPVSTASAGPRPAAPKPPPRRSWLRLQFSLGTLFWLMLVAGMGAMWWKDRSSFDQRLKKLEEMYAPSKPQIL